METVHQFTSTGAEGTSDAQLSLRFLAGSGFNNQEVCKESKGQSVFDEQIKHVVNPES